VQGNSAQNNIIQARATKSKKSSLILELKKRNKQETEKDLPKTKDQRTKAAMVHQERQRVEAPPHGGGILDQDGILYDTLLRKHS